MVRPGVETLSQSIRSRALSLLFCCRHSLALPVARRYTSFLCCAVLLAYFLSTSFTIRRCCWRQWSAWESPGLRFWQCLTRFSRRRFHQRAWASTWASSTFLLSFLRLLLPLR